MIKLFCQGSNIIPETSCKLYECLRVQDRMQRTLSGIRVQSYTSNHHGNAVMPYITLLLQSIYWQLVCCLKLCIRSPLKKLLYSTHKLVHVHTK